MEKGLPRQRCSGGTLRALTRSPRAGGGPAPTLRVGYSCTFRVIESWAADSCTAILDRAPAASSPPPFPFLSLPPSFPSASRRELPTARAACRERRAPRPAPHGHGPNQRRQLLLPPPPPAGRRFGTVRGGGNGGRATARAPMSGCRPHVPLP